jgi:flavin-dependent dehydrogenase
VAKPRTQRVCVVGAGPAGCLIAYRLATLGHDVALIARQGPRRHPMGETAPATVAQLLEGVGLGEVMAMAAYRVAAEGLARWESEEPVVHPSPGLLLRRDRFDALLRMAAEQAGARVIEIAGGVTLERKVGGGWRVFLTGAAGAGEIDAAFLVDARGRSAGRRRLGAATIALCARWRDARPLPAATCLEAVSDAWIWGGVGPDRRQAAACFVDPRRLAGLDAAGRTALYVKLLGGARLLRPLLAGALCEAPFVLDATARLGSRIAEPGLIAVGDAAMAAEPLSSQGLQNAIVSALQGAAAAHTALTRPEDAPLALDFHRASREAAAQSAMRHTASFHAAVLGRFDTPFWRRRAAASEPALPTPAEAAAGPDAPLRLSPSARIRDGAVLDGALIRRERVLEGPGLHEPIAYLGAVKVAPLLEATQFPMVRKELVRAWSEMIGLDDARAAIAWLWSRRLLVAA